MTQIATELEQLHVYHRDATSELVVTFPLRPDGPSDWDEGQADGIWRDLYNDAADQAGVSSRANGSGDETQIAVTLPDSETVEGVKATLDKAVGLIDTTDTWRSRYSGISTEAREAVDEWWESLKASRPE
jgi:hypothetical protein